jgi:hypothetical protein
VEGNGKNGFAKGEFGVTVDNSYKSSSGNFIALQKAANDESAKANIDVLNPTDSFSVRVSLTYSSKSGLGPPTSMSMTPGGDGGFAGYTFFPPGSNSPQPYSNDSDTDMVINNSSDVPQGIAHELRHVVLGDFGRSGLKGVHGVPEVDRQTKAAEDEAAQNEKE